jgi:preprotein translocase subunit YajC
MDYTSLLMVAVVVAAGYFLMIRPAQKRQAAQQKTVNEIVPGTRIMTTAGVFGTVRHLGEKQAVIEIAPGIEMTVLKGAIARVAKPDEDEFEYEDDDDLEPGEETADDDGFGQAIAGFDAPDAADPLATRDPDEGPDYQGYPKPDEKN